MERETKGIFQRERVAAKLRLSKVSGHFTRPSCRGENARHNSRSEISWPRRGNALENLLNGSCNWGGVDWRSPSGQWRFLLTVARLGERYQKTLFAGEARKPEETGVEVGTAESKGETVTRRGARENRRTRGLRGRGWDGIAAEREREREREETRTRGWKWGAM